MTNHYYAGFEDVRLERPSNSHEVLDRIDSLAAAVGIDYTRIPAVRRARALAGRADVLEGAIPARLAQARARMAVHPDWLDEETTNLDDVVTEALAAGALLDEGVRTEAQRVINATIIEAHRLALAELHKVTEDQWLTPLRPVMARLIKQANEDADAIGVEQARDQQPGVRTMLHPWSPHPDQLTHNTAVRHAWERLLDDLATIDKAHAVADYLRSVGLLPVVPGRTMQEEYRWLHLDRLSGRLDSRLLREWYLENRHDAAPGIYSAAELARADTDEPPAEDTAA